MVAGATELAKENQLYFLTITCRGRDMSLQESEANYLKWCNRLFTALRTDAKRSGQHWHYAVVTERQKRGHPHSHILTTYKPKNIYDGFKDNWKRIGGVLVNEPISCLRSDWLLERCKSAGLGSQYDISLVRSEKAASRYIAKYLFKDTAIGNVWPKGWKRIRYSQSWPQLPDTYGDNEAVALLGQEAWSVLGHKALVIQAKEEVC
jgi:hypothetical protein